MRKGTNKHTGRPSNVQIRIEGLEEFINQIEKIKGNMPRLLREGTHEAGDIIYNELKTLGFIKYGNRTGKTAAALRPVKLLKSETFRVAAFVGYDFYAPHGEVAIFLNYGSPTTSPGAFFIQKAKDRTSVEIAELFQRKIDEVVRKS